MTDFEDWKRRAQEADILEEAIARGATLKRAGKEHTGPCPACGGKDRFSINAGKRIFNCRGSVGGDVIGMVMHIDGLSFTQACEALTGEPPPNGHSKPLSEPERQERARQRLEAEARQRVLKAQQEAYEADTREAAQAIWDASRPVPGTLAEVYLRSRGIVLEKYPDVLRFHPALPYPGKSKRYPVLVSRVDDLGGALTAVWRIFLRDDGRKADVPNAKLGLGPSAGGAVRLGGVESHIGIAEGVETALGAWLLNGCRYPVWSGLSTAISSLEIPLGVDWVTIFPDGDRPVKKQGDEYQPAVPAGRRAANALYVRLVEEGLRCNVAAEPPIGMDYLDLWVASQREVA